MRYGLCYKGSKNAVAEWIISELPRADVFVDLFCGGGGGDALRYVKRQI